MRNEETRDPVCMMPVEPATALHVDRGERRFFFCSEFCRQAFLKDPAAYLTAASAVDHDARARERRIAYFTMEIALESQIPTYAGGLGVLAGDMVKSCADLSVPLVAVTLLQREGYFVQALDARLGQRESPARWSPQDVLRPLNRVIVVNIEDRAVRVTAWVRDVTGQGGFRIPVLFLDTDLPQNAPFDRSLCGTLYGGNEHYRLCQEAVLGVGGVRMLQALGFRGLQKYHLNEGHAALATLELARRANAGVEAGAWRFAGVRQQCVFTTHTPVAAGHDQFARAMVDRVLGNVVPTPVLDMLGGRDRLNMTALALNQSAYVNGVAASHERVSREMFPGYVIQHVTNGVHSRTWTATAFAELYDRYLPGWFADPFLLRNAGRIPADQIWDAHMRCKADLLEIVDRLTGRKLSPDFLTLGIARRATAYKRADLIISDLARLREAAEGGQLQLVFAGKAHPRDEPGKTLIRRVLEFAETHGAEIPTVYLPDYDMGLAQKLVAGVDLWLNTPQRPLEASGTSGMKAAHNGVPSFSVLDGWWLEGHIEGATGWSIGPPSPVGAGGAQTSRELEDLYDKLRLIIAPMFYRQREQWITVMRSTIALNASFFNTHRMVQQYVTNAYL